MKNFRLFRNKYYQGKIDDNDADNILRLVTEYDNITSLVHVIKNLPDYKIMEIKRDAESYYAQNKTMKGFNIDYTKDAPVGTLKDYQTIGVGFMFWAKSALLGDEVGLGKTVQCAGLCNLLDSAFAQKGKDFKFCFLTEKTSVGQIRDKLIQFTGKYVGMLESGEQRVVASYIKDNAEHKHYSIVGGHSLLTSAEFLTFAIKSPFDLIIIDESSILKNTSSDVFKNTKSLFKLYDRKVLLNATPLEQGVKDFYNQLDLLDSDFMPTWTDFARMFCKMEKGMYGYHIAGYKNSEIFKEAVSLRYLGRNRVGQGASYEGNKYEMQLIPLSEAQRVLMRKTTLYSMVVDYPTGVDRNIPYTPETTPKLAALLEILSNIDVVNDKALIYCRFKECQRELIEMLSARGFRCVMLNGDTKSKERNEIIKDFNNGVYDILLTNVQKGIDLDTCNTCILYTIDPNPQKMVQVEGRMTRAFDVEYKSLYLLVSMGKEKKFVEEKLKMRVDASSSFVNVGRSMVTDAIKNVDDGNRVIKDVSSPTPLVVPKSNLETGVESSNSNVVDKVVEKDMELPKPISTHEISIPIVE